MWTGQKVQEKKNHRAARDETCALVCGFCSLCRELIPLDISGRFVGVCRAVCKADRCGRRCNRTGVILFCRLNCGSICRKIHSGRQSRPQVYEGFKLS